MVGRITLFTLLGALLLASRAWSHEPLLSRFTYQKDVLPIFTQHCSGCHESGGAGPMSLFKYEEAFPWAASVKTEVLEGRMPPWLPEEGWGEFRGARGLSAREIDVLVDWASGAAPEGVPAPEPARRARPDSLGDPALVLEIPETVLGKEVSEKTACWSVSTGLTKPRWASAFEFLPGNTGVVRSVTVTRDAACEGRPLLAWLPGDGPLVLPKGVGELLPAGSRLQVKVRYRKSWRDDGKEVRDRSQVALYFSKAATRVQALRVDRSPLTLDRDVQVLSVFPILDAGESICVEAHTPEDLTVPVIRILRFDPGWSTKFVYRNPLILQKGTLLEAEPPKLWVEYVAVGRSARR